jgi:hypothetical protein
MLISAYKTMQLNGHPLPNLVFTDKCCADRSFFESTWPSLKLGLYKPFFLPLPENVLCISKQEDVPIVILKFFRMMEQIDDESKLKLAMDLEWPRNKRTTVVSLATKVPEGKF